MQRSERKVTNLRNTYAKTPTKHRTQNAFTAKQFSTARHDAESINGTPPHVVTTPGLDQSLGPGWTDANVSITVGGEDDHASHRQPPDGESGNPKVNDTPQREISPIDHGP